MTKILVVAELSPSGSLKNGTLSAITFAQKAAPAAGGAFDLIILGKNTSNASAALSSYGAERVLACDAPELEAYLAEYFAPTVAKVARSYSLVVATASSFGKDLLPRVAARLGAAYASDCSDVEVDGDSLIYRRPMFAGNALGWCKLSTPIQVATVRQSEFAPAATVGSTSPVENVAYAAPGTAAERIEFVSVEATDSKRPELTDADVIVAGGRALGERFGELLEPLADELGAALGATRAAVDGGYCPGDFQVGQTGKVVAPKLYIAVGISGAIQHVAGMKGSKVIVAINKDKDAPIFQFADYGLVADLFTTIPELLAALKSRS